MQNLNEITGGLAILSLMCAAWAMRKNLSFNVTTPFGWFSLSLFTITSATFFRMTWWDIVGPNLLDRGLITSTQYSASVWLVNGAFFNPLVILSVYFMMRALLLMIPDSYRSNYTVFSVWLYPYHFRFKRNKK